METLSCYVNGKQPDSPHPEGPLPPTVTTWNAAKNQEVSRQTTEQTNQFIHQKSTEHLLWPSAVLGSGSGVVNESDTPLPS